MLNVGYDEIDGSCDQFQLDHLNGMFYLITISVMELNDGYILRHKEIDHETKHTFNYVNIFIYICRIEFAGLQF